MVPEWVIGLFAFIIAGIFIGVMAFAAISSDNEEKAKRNTFISQCIKLDGIPTIGDTNKCIKDGSVIFSSK